MMGFIYAAVIVAALILFMWLLVKTVDGNVQARVGVILLITLIIGVTLNIALKENEKGPCHKYETQMMYNSATKTMMLSRVCVLRGEWVKESHESK